MVEQEHAALSDSAEAVADIRTVQELLGHADVRTTMIYAHVLNEGGRWRLAGQGPLSATLGNSQSRRAP